MSRIGQVLTRAELSESIRIPDLTVAPEYRSFLPETRDGRAVRDGPDAIIFHAADLAEMRIARKDIERMTPATTRGRWWDLIQFGRRREIESSWTEHSYWLECNPSADDSPPALFRR